MEKKFPKTIEVFNKIAQHEVLDPFSPSTPFGWEKTTYKVSEKQFDWLKKVYAQEANGFNVANDVSVRSEDNETQYSFGYSKMKYNVPHYIPARRSYGVHYFIYKYIKTHG